MKRWMEVAIVSLVASAVPAPVWGQAVDTVYVGTEHSPWTSGFVEFFVPTAGFAYAGDWKRGLLPNAFRIGTMIGFDVTYDDGTETCEDTCRVWAVAALATTVWSIVGAVQTAKDHNSAIRELDSPMLLEPAPHGGMSVGLRIAW